MADAPTVEQQRAFQESLNQAGTMFQAIRAGLNLPVKDAAAYTADDAVKTFEEFAKFMTTRPQNVRGDRVEQVRIGLLSERLKKAGLPDALTDSDAVKQLVAGTPEAIAFLMQAVPAMKPSEAQIAKINAIGEGATLKQELARAGRTEPAQPAGPAARPAAGQGAQREAMTEVAILSRVLGLDPTQYSPAQGAQLLAAAQGQTPQDILPRIREAVIANFPDNTTAQTRALARYNNQQGAATLLADAPGNIAMLNGMVAARPQQPTTAQAAPAAGTAPTQQTAAQIREPFITAVNTALVPMGMDVRKPQDFKNFRDLMAVMTGVSVSNGAPTPEDFVKLGQAWEAFKNDPKKLKALETIAEGNVPAGYPGALSLLLSNPKDANDLATRSKNIAAALGAAAKKETDGQPEFPELKALHDSIVRVNPALMGNLFPIITTLKANGTAVFTNLQTVAQSDAVLAPPPIRVAAAGSAGAAVAAQALQAQTAQAAPAAPAAVVQVPGASNPPPAQAPAAGVAGADPVIDTTDKAIKVAEEALLRIGPQLQRALGPVGGMMAKMGAFTLLTKAEAEDGVFDQKSKKLAAVAIMGLKQMAGDEAADGTYNAAIGKDLLEKILTDDKLKAVRDAFDLQKVDRATATILMNNKPPEMARDLQEAISKGQELTLAQGERKERHERLLKEHEKARELRMFFAAMDKLADEKNRQLLADQEAQGVNRMNMFVDMAAGILDKVPFLKNLITKFLGSEFGQMIAGVAGAVLGVDLNRLVMGKQEREQTTGLSQEDLVRKSEPVIKKGFENVIAEAKRELGGTPTLAQILDRTERDMLRETDGTAYKAIASVLFEKAQPDMIRQAIAEGMKAARTGTDEADAAAKFAAKITELGVEYRKKYNPPVSENTEQRLRQLLQEAGGPSVTTAPPPVPAPAATTAPPAAPAPAATASPAAVAAAATGVGAPALGGTNNNREPSAPAAAEPPPRKSGELRFTVGDQIVSLEAGNKGTETGNFGRQAPARVSNGRMAEISKLLIENWDKLGIESVKLEQLRDSKGKPVDAATHALTQALTELSVRGQIRAGLDTDKGIQPRLTHDMLVMYALSEVKHKAPDADVTKAKAAIDSMAHDFDSYAKGAKKPAAKDRVSVLAQTFAGYKYNVVTYEKAAPAPVAAESAPAEVPPPAAPAAAAPIVPAPAAAAAPKDLYAGVIIPPGYEHVFEAYKKLNNIPNCPDGHTVPLVFQARIENGKMVMRPKDADDKGCDEEVAKQYQAFVGYFDRKTNEFKVAPIGAGDQNYLLTHKVPADINAKLIENYVWTIQSPDANGVTTPIKIGFGGQNATAAQRPLVEKEIKDFIHCNLGTLPLRMEFSQAAKPVAQAPAPAAPAAPQASRPAAAEQPRAEQRPAERQERPERSERQQHPRAAHLDRLEAERMKQFREGGEGQVIKVPCVGLLARFTTEAGMCDVKVGGRLAENARDISGQEWFDRRRGTGTYVINHGIINGDVNIGHQPGRRN